MLVIFDNDGTLCDTQDVEGRCYASAIETVTGISLADTDWARFEERTSSAIVRQLLADDREWEEKERQIKQEFCRLLREACADFPGDFSPLSGAVKFLERVRAEGFGVAIATGGFDSEAAFKLRCCGIELDRYPHATASDTPKRREIIRLAAARAGMKLETAVYFADAPWDVRVSAELGIPMIGIGRRREQLYELGVRFAFRDYSEPDNIMSALHALRAQSSPEPHPIQE